MEKNRNTAVGREEMLGNAPLGRLMLSLALPTVAAQIINVLYNIVDRIYIGHIEGYGQLALTGVGVTFPIITLISAFSGFAGQGGAPLASIELGRKNREGAEKILGGSFAMLITFAVILTIVFQIFKTPILYAFGASDNTIIYAQEYITIYLIGTIFVQLALGLNPYISAQGNAKTAMLSIVIGAVTNIILDPIFIFLFGMGVKGAALATIISQALSALWIVRFLVSEKSAIRIKRQNVRLEGAVIKKISMLGISPFIMQSTESLIMITLNTGLLRYGGDLYVGTMSVMTSIMQLIVIPVQGVSSGVQPIMSYNFGAGNFKRVKDTFMRMEAVCLAVTLLMGGAVVTNPEIFVRMFSESEELIALTCQYAPVYFFGITIFGIQMGCQTTFLALGQAKVSLTIALLRKVVLLIPMAIIFPKFMGVFGVYFAEPVADITSVTITVILFIITVKKLLHTTKKSDMIKKECE